MNKIKDIRIKKSVASYSSIDLTYPLKIRIANDLPDVVEVELTNPTCQPTQYSDLEYFDEGIIIKLKLKQQSKEDQEK